MNTKVNIMSLRSGSATVVIPSRLLRRPASPGLLAMTITFLLAMTFAASPAFASELANQFTVSLWVNPQTSVTSKALAVKDTEIRLYTDASGYANCAIYTTSWQTGAVGTTALPLNTWSHVSCTYDKANIKIFVGGIQQNSVAQTAAVNDAATNWRVGSDEGATYADLAGTTDDFKIYNYARTQKQIVEDMNGGGSVIASGARQSASGAVGAWKFDEGQGTIANNSGSIGNTLNGTIYNGTWSNSGKFGKALNMTNTTDTVSMGDTSFTDGLTAMTVSLWINPTTLAGNKGLIGKWDNVTGDSNSFMLRTTDSSSSNLFFFVANNVIEGGSNYLTTSNLGLANGTWSHIVAVYDGSESASNRAKIYKDGKLQSGTIGGTIPTSMTTGSTSNLTIGRGYSNALAGVYDEVKIYNYALTSDEVKTEYNSSSAISFGRTSTESDGTTPSSSSARGYCIPGDASTCSAPIGEWNFEEGSGASAQDSSGNGNTGTLTLGPTWTSGKIGKGLSFDGSDDYVNVADNSSLDFGTGDFTIESWIKFNAAPTGNAVVTKYGNNNLFYTFQLDGLGKLYASMRPDATAYAYRVGATTLTTGQWYHVAAVFDRDLNNGMQTVYVNGVNDNGSGGYAGVNTTTLDNAGSLTIGLVNGSLGASYHNGLIDQVKIFNYARTPAQIAYDYNKGKPVGWWKFDECQGTTANDSSGNGNTGTITIGASGTQTSVGNCSTSATTAWYSGRTGKYNSSLNFDGTDDIVSITNSTSLDSLVSAGQFTVSAWLNRSGWSADAFPVTNGDGDIDWNLDIDVTANSVACRMVSGGSAHTSSTNVPITNGTWKLITCVWDGSNLKTYGDGKLIDTTSATGTLRSVDQELTVGGRYSTNAVNSVFNGQIDDVQIYNYALTPLQIKLLYNENASVRFGPNTGSP